MLREGAATAVAAGEPKFGAATLQHELVATVTGTAGTAGVVVLASKDGA